MPGCRFVHPPWVVPAVNMHRAFLVGQSDRFPFNRCDWHRKLESSADTILHTPVRPSR